MVWMPTAGAGWLWQGTRLSPEQRSVHTASTRDLITGCLKTPRTKQSSSCLLGLSDHIWKMAFHSAAPNPLGAFLSTLGKIPSPPQGHLDYLIWTHPHITVLSPLPLCPRHTSFCSQPQTNSFHLETCAEAVLDAKYTYPPSHFNVHLITQGLKQGSSSWLL